VILVRQYRYSIQSDLLEIPAGTLQADEEPSDCARRELEEETGYRCGEIVKLLECFVAPGYSTEKIHVFLARNLTKTQTRMDEDEIINVERVKFSEALRRIRAGEIQDAKSIVGLRAAESLIKG
jgi:ADP-ribose pyrophosphatase